MAIKICLRIASRWTISHAFIFMYVYYCITYGMCHNFNLAAVNIAWTNIKKYTYTQTKLSNLENFIIKFHVIRYYFWVMVHIRIFDKFLPPHFIHTSHITTHTQSKISCNGFTLTSVWCVERVVELRPFFLFR